MSTDMPDDKVMHKAPLSIGEAQDRITARDRVFFEEHPSRTQYKRPYQVPEFWPILYDPDANLYVEITQLRPGIRTRRLLGDAIGYVPDNPEWLGENDFEATVKELRNAKPLPEGWAEKIKHIVDAMPPSDTPRPAA